MIMNMKEQLQGLSVKNRESFNKDHRALDLMDQFVMGSSMLTISVNHAKGHVEWSISDQVTVNKLEYAIMAFNTQVGMIRQDYMNGYAKDLGEMAQKDALEKAKADLEKSNDVKVNEDVKIEESGKVDEEM